MIDSAQEGYTIGEQAARTAVSEPVPTAPLAPGDDFAAALGRVQDAAREWGIRPDLVEGKFVSALMAAVEWLGRVSQAAQLEFRTLHQKQRDSAELELACAREITKAAHAALGQTRSALINLQVERENVTIRMIHETMPMFATELRKALMIRINDETSALRLRRSMLAGTAAVAIFLGGFGLRAWDDRDAVGMLERCLAKPLQAQNAGQLHLYCDVTSFAAASQ